MAFQHNFIRPYFSYCGLFVSGLVGHLNVLGMVRMRDEEEHRRLQGMLVEQLQCLCICLGRNNASQPL